MWMKGRRGAGEEATARPQQCAPQPSTTSRTPAPTDHDLAEWQNAWASPMGGAPATRGRGGVGLRSGRGVVRGYPSRQKVCALSPLATLLMVEGAVAGAPWSSKGKVAQLAPNLVMSYDRSLHRLNTLYLSWARGPVEGGAVAEAEAEDEVSCSPHLGGRTLSVRARLVLALEEAHDLLDRVAVQRLRAARRQALARRTAVRSVRAAHSGGWCGRGAPWR